MKIRQTTVSMVLVIVLLFSACGAAADASAAGSREGPVVSSVETIGSGKEEVSQDGSGRPSSYPGEFVFGTYSFNPHLHSGILSRFYTEERMNSLYNLCDALREGRDTFECADRETYDWCMDSVTLAHMFPAACMVVGKEDGSGSESFENGTGRICYDIPAEEFVKRQAGFETLVEEILNSVLEDDDTDFEKCLKLYAYMESTYTYEYDTFDHEGFTYSTFMHKLGICENLSGVYVYLLLQAGVDALSIGCFNGIQHAWTYVILDGEGYHIDPTWALHEEGEPLNLTYFMNSERARNAYGVPTDDLTAAMVPGFWLNFSQTELPADSEKFACFLDSVFVSLDEESKTIYYEDGLGVHGLKYEK